jgi:hypothetical protein
LDFEKYFGGFCEAFFDIFKNLSKQSVTQNNGLEENIVNNNCELMFQNAINRIG